MDKRLIWLVALCLAAQTPAQERDKPKPERPAPEKQGEKQGERPQDKPKEKPQDKPQDKAGQRPAQNEPNRGQDLSPGDQRLNGALDEFSTRVGNRQLESADYERLRTALRERHAGAQLDARARARAMRIDQQIDDFEQRGKRQALKAQHVDMLREQLIDERLDMAIERWRKAADAGKVTEAEYRDMTRELEQRARVAQSFDPDAGTMRTRLQARLDEFQRRGAANPVRAEDIASFEHDLLDLRLQHAIANLERNAAANDLTRADLARVRGILEDNAASAYQDAEFKQLSTRLNNAIDQLDAKVAAGKVDATEVAQLKTLLVRKAREAGADVPKPNEPKRDGDKPKPPQ